MLWIWDFSLDYCVMDAESSWILQYLLSSIYYSASPSSMLRVHLDGGAGQLLLFIIMFCTTSWFCTEQNPVPCYWSASLQLLHSTGSASHMLPLVELLCVLSQDFPVCF